MAFKSGFKKLGIGLAAFVLLAEVGLRLSGITNFPIYEVDEKIGYIPAHDQAGLFIHKNHWVVNDLNMGVAEKWAPHGKKDAFLIGDSLVWGGNPLDQPAKLGPQLQQKAPNWKIWPVSAGSWSVANPLIWMKRHPQATAEMDSLIWIINSGDFAPASQWKSDDTHPRARPTSALDYVLKKYVLARLGLKTVVPESTGTENGINTNIANMWARNLTDLANKGVRLTIVCYPNSDQLKEDSSASQFKQFRAIAYAAKPKQAVWIDLSRLPSWNTSLYRDSIHPNEKGCAELAKIIQEKSKLF
jgi:hypothetical protein